MLLGEVASGLSPANINRLLAVWGTEYEAFRERDLSEVDYVYVWADGIHVNVRLGEQDRIYLLVLLGARPDGTKELIAVEDGYRESTESWSELLRDLMRRGMHARRSRSEMERSGSGRQSATCGPRRASSRTGYTGS